MTALEATLLQVIKKLGSDYPDGQKCFCQMAVGNPMISSHSSLCISTREIIKETEDK